MHKFLNTKIGFRIMDTAGCAALVGGVFTTGALREHQPIMTAAGIGCLSALVVALAMTIPYKRF